MKGQSPWRITNSWDSIKAVNKLVYIPEQNSCWIKFIMHAFLMYLNRLCSKNMIVIMMQKLHENQQILKGFPSYDITVTSLWCHYDITWNCPLVYLLRPNKRNCILYSQGNKLFFQNAFIKINIFRSNTLGNLNKWTIFLIVTWLWLEF